jgi:hypothetical protein
MTPALLLRQSILNQMNEATSYQAWQTSALELDRADGLDKWKMRFDSTEFDYLLIRDCLDQLYQARRDSNIPHALFLLRTTLRRNIGNIMSDELYQCATGTKDLIEQYTEEVVYHLRAISKATIPGMT